MLREDIPAGSCDRGGPPPGQGRALRPWRVAAALVCPPLVTLAVFFAGLAINSVPTDYAPVRFFVVIALCSPLASAAGLVTADALTNTQPVTSWRGKAAVAALVLTGLITSVLAWWCVFFTYSPRAWGG